MRLKTLLQTVLYTAIGYLGMASTAQAETIQESLNKIKQATRSQRTGHSVYSGAPFDTVDVFEKGDLTINSGKEFTSFYERGSERSLYLFDIRNDGRPNIIVLTKGRVKSIEENRIELTGLAGTSSLEFEVSMNHMEQELSGRTHYNTREVYAPNYRDSSVAVYDFDKNESGRVRDARAIGTFEGLYKGVIVRAKKALGLFQ